MCFGLLLLLPPSFEDIAKDEALRVKRLQLKDTNAKLNNLSNEMQNPINADDGSIDNKNAFPYDDSGSRQNDKEVSGTQIKLHVCFKALIFIENKHKYATSHY